MKKTTRETEPTHKESEDSIFFSRNLFCCQVQFSLLSSSTDGFLSVDSRLNSRRSACVHRLFPPLPLSGPHRGDWSSTQTD